MLVTALSPTFGYDRAVKISHKAAHDGSSLREPSPSAWPQRTTTASLIPHGWSATRTPTSRCPVSGIREAVRHASDLLERRLQPELLERHDLGAPTIRSWPRAVSALVSSLSGVRSPGHLQRVQAVHDAEDPEVHLLVRFGQGEAGEALQ